MLTPAPSLSAGRHSIWPGPHCGELLLSLACRILGQAMRVVAGGCSCGLLHTCCCASSQQSKPGSPRPSAGHHPACRAAGVFQHRWWAARVWLGGSSQAWGGWHGVLDVWECCESSQRTDPGSTTTWRHLIGGTHAALLSFASVQMSTSTELRRPTCASPCPACRVSGSWRDGAAAAALPAGAGGAEPQPGSLALACAPHPQAASPSLT